METIKAIIVDDEPNAKKALRGLLSENFEEVEIVADCSDVPDAVKTMAHFIPKQFNNAAR